MLASGASLASQARYAFDPVHTRVAFQISHAGFSNPVGTFSRIEGELQFDEADWSTARLKVRIPMTTLELGDAGTRFITRVDYSHESSTPINNGLPGFNRALGNTRIFERAVNLVNASATLALSNGIEVGAFARNLLNDQYILTVFDGVAQAGTVTGYPSQPRTYGGVVRFKF